MATGGVGLVVDMVALAFLVEVADLAPVAGKVLSAEAALVVMFLVNERWTFRRFGGLGLGELVRRFLTSHVVRLTGFGIALGLLYLLTSYLGVPYLLANGIGIGAGFVANYALESLATWRVHLAGGGGLSSQP